MKSGLLLTIAIEENRIDIPLKENPNVKIPDTKRILLLLSKLVPILPDKIAKNFTKPRSIPAKEY